MIIGLFIAVNVYLFLRGWQALPEITALRIIYAGIFILIISCFGLGFYLNGSLPYKVENVFKLIGRFWIFFLLIFFFAALLADFLRILEYFFKVFPGWVIENYSLVKTGYLIMVLSVSVLVGVTGFRQYSKPRIIDLDLTLSKEKKPIGDLKIVAASDLHLGMIVQKEKLAEWVELINKQDPDIILLLGDIFDRSLKPRDSQDLIYEFRKLRSKYGVYAVLGNHDYYIKVDRAIDYLKQSGITLLRDQSVIVDDRFVLVGRDDITNRKLKTISSLMSKVDTAYPVILLSHRPTDLHEAAENKIDLQLSGHLHNGQIFPVNLIYSKLWELSYGYRKIGNTHIYVSSGLGLSYIPMRLGTYSELVRIHLRSDNEGRTGDKN